MEGAAEYQYRIANQGAEILRKYKMLMLVMKMRTRKTTTTFMTIEKMGYLACLFVTKKKAIRSIEEDYERTFRSFDIEVINYESVHKIDQDYLDICDVVVLDESHSLGAFPKKSKKVDKIKKIVGQKPVIFLSATPTPESFSQIYHQLYVTPYSPFNAYTSFYKWAKDYVTIKQRMIRSMMVNDYSHAIDKKLKPLIDPFTITLTQEEAGFQAIAKDRIVYLDRPDPIPYLQNELEKNKVAYYFDKVATINQAADLPMKLSQLAGGTLIFDNNEKGTVLSTAKAEYIKEYCKGKKIAIFYKFVAEFEVLKRVFPNFTESPEEFQSRNDLTFIGQFVSSREGVNLSTADHLVMYNTDWSATTYFQVRARFQTLTRTREAIVLWFFFRGSIEEQIYNRVKNKKNFTASYYRNITKKKSHEPQSIKF